MAISVVAEQAIHEISGLVRGFARGELRKVEVLCHDLDGTINGFGLHHMSHTVSYPGIHRANGNTKSGLRQQWDIGCPIAESDNLLGTDTIVLEHLIHDLSLGILANPDRNLAVANVVIKVQLIADHPFNPQFAGGHVMEYGQARADPHTRD